MDSQHTLCLLDTFGSRVTTGIIRRTLEPMEPYLKGCCVLEYYAKLQASQRNCHILDLDRFLDQSDFLMAPDPHASCISCIYYYSRDLLSTTAILIIYRRSHRTTLTFICLINIYNIIRLAFQITSHRSLTKTISPFIITTPIAIDLRPTKRIKKDWKRTHFYFISCIPCAVSLSRCRRTLTSSATHP